MILEKNEWEGTYLSMDKRMTFQDEYEQRREFFNTVYLWWGLSTAEQKRWLIRDAIDKQRVCTCYYILKCINNLPNELREELVSLGLAYELIKNQNSLSDDGTVKYLRNNPC